MFTYTLVVDNDSAVPVVITSLTDSNSALSPDFAAKCGILVGTTLAADVLPEPGGADEKTCSYTVTRTSVGVYDNTAVVKVKMVDDSGPEATDEAKATVSVTAVPKLTIDKSVKNAADLLGRHVDRRLRRRGQEHRDDHHHLQPD